jgi:hypothetical protein
MRNCFEMISYALRRLETPSRALDHSLGRRHDLHALLFASCSILARFFKAVLIVSTVAIASGLWMVGRVAKQTVQAGGNFSWPTSWIVMTVLGLLMFAIFGHIRFALFKRLQRAVANADTGAAAAALATIRTWVGVNLGLGIAIIASVYLLR